MWSKYLLSYFLITLISVSAPASLSYADYPTELCQERTYWKPLPKPDGVIGLGYNAIKGPVSVPIFNVTSYDGVRSCRLTVRTKPDGRTVVEGYRLPGYVEEYSFDETGDAEDDDADGKKDADEDGDLRRLRFTLITYESTAQAYMEMRRRWGLIIDDGTDYESLFFTLQAPLRYYGAKNFADTLQKTVKDEAAAAPFYTLRVETVAGRFSMKPYRFAHFANRFAQRMRDVARKSELLEDEEKLVTTFFDQYGTHYPIAGTFGGIDERRVSFSDYFDARCGRKVTIDQLATCDGLKLKYVFGFPNVRVLLRPMSGDIHKAKVVDLEAARNESWESCKHVVDPIHRVSTYVASAGGKLSIRRALHTSKLFPADLGNVDGWRNWLDSIPSEPATVKTRMAPICELIAIVDRRSDAKAACQNRLIQYLNRREQLLLAQPETCDTTIRRLAVGFETQQRDFWDALLEMRSNNSVTTYCVPMDSFDQITPCPQAAQDQRPYHRPRQHRPSRPFRTRGGHSAANAIYSSLPLYLFITGSLVVWTLGNSKTRAG